MRANAIPTARHQYEVHLVWEGNRGSGTAGYAAYDRTYTASMPGKPPLMGSADPAFRGDGSRYNPEDLFLTALGACHMLFFLGLCARDGIRVLAYRDHVQGTLNLHGGGGRFDGVTLAPAVVVAEEGAREAVLRFHQLAHERCFIANSCSVPVRIAPTVHVGMPPP